MNRETFDVDVLIVGAGPAGLSCAIKLAKLAQETSTQINIAVIEKAREAGVHQLSGAILDPKALAELIPDFPDKGAPIEAEVTEDNIWFLTESDFYPLPVASTLNNHGCYVISLGRFTRWLAKIAEDVGVNLFFGFPGSKVLIQDDKVTGVRTLDKGIDKHGNKKPNYEPGIDIIAKATVLCDGTHGTLTRQLVKHFNLDLNKNPQIYATGVKEVWHVPGGFPQGRVIHTLGYPLKGKTFGGSFIYGMADNKISIGLIVGLDYQDPFTDIHHEFQVFKMHPKIREIIDGGKLLEYGAKTIPEGGYFSIPRLYTAGALITGDSAGLVNLLRLKGIHLAMKSGIIAAEVCFDALKNNNFNKEQLATYEKKIYGSWVMSELRSSRYFKQGFKSGMIAGLINAGLSQIFSGWSPADKRLKPGHTHMKKIALDSKPQRIKFDDEITFNKVTDVYYSSTIHDENTPCHLLIKDPDICVNRCSVEYGNPCQYFCPANVYEWISDESRLQINFTNCVHCKTCDIMDPYQIIEWVVPEGGGGPNYKNL